jgi:hypothetical protein
MTKVKYIANCLLVLVFLAPTMFKLGHHHDHFTCDAYDVVHFHEQHEKCEVCKFEFSVFSAYRNEIIFQKVKPCDHFRNNYQSLYFTNHSKFSFLLRAPPVITI